MVFYSPKSASFIQPCKMGFHKWHILVDSKISHLCGCTVFRPSKIYSILSENGHIIMPLGVPLLISNACSVLLLYLPLLFSPFPPLLCPEKENLSQCTDMYHPSAGKINVLSIYSPKINYSPSYYISPIEIGLRWAKITYLKSHSKALGFTLQTNMK